MPSVKPLYAMKTTLYISLIFFCSFSGFSQDSDMLCGKWNGGQAFDGQDPDSILLFQFDLSEFHFQYGPNTYARYKSYEINSDTLILKKDDDFQEAAFRIETLNDTILEIQALNWTAVHISNTLCSPWTNTEAPAIPIDRDFETQAILENEVLRTKLSFRRIGAN